MMPWYALLPLAAAAFALGWWASRRASARRSGAAVNELSSDYFRGLNYLLNEEQDKAIEV
ncbi:MAG TPA: lipopolysaccharide assembly protein LapB, partial [Rhodanobacter sp.]